MNTLTDEEIKGQILHRTKELLDYARRHYALSHTPLDIRFEKEGRGGGSAGKTAGRYYLNFNLALARENLDEYLNQVIGHELSHIIDLWLHKDVSSHHGYEWQCIMVQCYGLVPARCHRMDTSGVSTRMSRNHVYRCSGCGREYNLTDILHRKIQHGQYRICNDCRSGIIILVEDKTEFDLGE